MINSLELAFFLGFDFFIEFFCWIHNVSHLFHDIILEYGQKFLDFQSED